jgi:hypothetical protein
MHHWALAAALAGGGESPAATTQRQSLFVPGSRRGGQQHPAGGDADGTVLVRQDDSQFRRSGGPPGATQVDLGRHGRHNFGHSTGHRLLSEARAVFDNSTHDWISSLRGVHLPNTYRRMSSKKRRGQRGGSGAESDGGPPHQWAHGFEQQNTVKDQVAIIAAQNQKLMQSLDDVKHTVHDLQQNKSMAEERLEAIEYLAKLQLSQSQRLLTSSPADQYRPPMPGGRARGYSGGGGDGGGYDPDATVASDLYPPQPYQQPQQQPQMYSHLDDGRGSYPQAYQPQYSSSRTQGPPVVPFSPMTGSGGGDDGPLARSSLLDPQTMPQLRLRPNRKPGDRTIVVDTSEDDDDNFLYGARVVVVAVGGVGVGGGDCG